MIASVKPAKASGFRPGDNPVDGVVRVLPRHKGDKTHHAALAYADVPAFVTMLREADATEATKLALAMTFSAQQPAAVSC